MKIKVVKINNLFSIELTLNSGYSQNFGTFQTKQEALDIGVQNLKKELQDALNDFKPRYRTKSKPVDAMQWFLGIILKENVKHSFCEGYNYCKQPIKPGDWVVNGKVVTNEEFEQDYEVIQ